MKTVISGTLGHDPALRQVKGSDGRMHNVVNFTVYAYDPTAPRRELPGGKEVPKGVPLHCTAWGENANEVSKYKKGDTITAVMELKYGTMKVGDSTVEQSTFLVRKIDTANQISKQLDDLLSGYEYGKYSKIFDKDAPPPDFSREVNLAKDMAEVKDYMQQRSSDPLIKNKEGK